VPLQAALIDVKLLSAPQLAWINAFHAECRAKVGPRLLAMNSIHAQPTMQWLQRATEPLVQ
jgi:Xaa-Pro aminopeptidase